MCISDAHHRCVGYGSHMRAATAWDDADWEGAHARGWTVMGVLRQRQDLHRKQATEARRRPAEARTTERLLSLSAASIQADYEDAIRARWQGGPTVLAFLFAHPDSDAIRMLDVRGDYFDQRTGDTWDLFFPGYYKSTQAARFEDETGARAVDVGYTDGWYFNARDFNMLREHVERASQGRWAFSGGTDLVLINGWMPDSGEPEIDWASTLWDRSPTTVPAPRR